MYLSTGIKPTINYGIMQLLDGKNNTQFESPNYHIFPCESYIFAFSFSSSEKS